MPSVKSAETVTRELTDIRFPHESRYGKMAEREAIGSNRGQI